MINLRVSLDIDSAGDENTALIDTIDATGRDKTGTYHRAEAQKQLWGLLILAVAAKVANAVTVVEYVLLDAGPHSSLRLVDGTQYLTHFREFAVNKWIGLRGFSEFEILILLASPVTKAEVDDE